MHDMIECAFPLHQVLYAYLANYKLSIDYFIFTTIVIRYYCVYPDPPYQLSLREETGAPGENPQLSAER
jgi:hypothetical protein